MPCYNPTGTDNGLYDGDTSFPYDFSNSLCSSGSLVRCGYFTYRLRYGEDAGSSGDTSRYTYASDYSSTAINPFVAGFRQGARRFAADCWGERSGLCGWDDGQWLRGDGVTQYSRDHRRERWLCDLFRTELQLVLFDAVPRSAGRSGRFGASKRRHCSRCRDRCVQPAFYNCCYSIYDR
jgi:hypothetical protein